MREMINQTFWKKADYVKRRLFSLIRIETSKINYLNYQEYRERFENIPNSLLKEWQKIEKGNSKVISKKLKGFLYEALFYYACLKTQTIFLDAELAEFGGAKFKESPPWFECIPLYDIIPNLHFIYAKEKKRRRVPQVKADFLITYVDNKGPSPPALIDVKSSEKVAKQHKEELGWQVVSAMRLGFIFQIAYPNPNLKSSYPTSLEEWVKKTPCPKCKELSDDYRKCTNCGAEIFPFTIVDSHYKLKELIEQLGKTYRGRF
jgi:hypothetical protein